MSKARKLKACPFCGAEVKTEPLYDTRGAITAIYCTNDPECGAMVTFVGNESKKKAFAAWERRATERDDEAKICAGGYIRNYAEPLEHCAECSFREGAGGNG